MDLDYILLLLNILLYKSGLQVILLTSSQTIVTHARIHVHNNIIADGYFYITYTIILYHDITGEYNYYYPCIVIMDATTIVCYIMQGYIRAFLIATSTTPDRLRKNDGAVCDIMFCFAARR